MKNKGDCLRGKKKIFIRNVYFISLQYIRFSKRNEIYILCVFFFPMYGMIQFSLHDIMNEGLFIYSQIFFPKHTKCTYMIDFLR